MQTNRKLLIVLSALFASTLGCSEGDDGRTSGFSAGESSPPSITTAQATTLLPTTGEDEMEGDTTVLPTTGGLDSDGCLPDPSAGVRCGSTSDSTPGGETDSTASGGETEGGQTNCQAGDIATITYTVPFVEILGDGEDVGDPEITGQFFAQRGPWGPGNSPTCTFYKQDEYYETSGPSQIVVQKSCKFDILLDPNKNWDELSTDIGFWAIESGWPESDTKVEAVVRVGFDWNMMQWTTQALGGQGSYWVDGVNMSFKVRMHFYWAVECVKP